MSDNPTSRRSPLEPSPETRAAWLAAISELVHAHIDGLSAAPAVGAIGEAGLRVAREVSTPIGELPLDGGMQRVAAILGRAAGAAMETAGPGYLAYIPGGGLYAAALADFASDVLNRFTGLAAAAPAFARLEADVIGWLGRQFGYDERAWGLLTPGGSLANFSAVCTARATCLGPEADLREAVIYSSTQAHHSVEKAARLAGFPARTLRLVPVDAHLRLNPIALRAAIAADRSAGRQPFLVVAAAGTTNTGAIDPLPELAGLCREEGLWLHIDGAYGGAFVLCEEGRRRLAGIELADSITFDPHKGLFLPYGTGCLLVRDGELLLRAHTGEATYLQDFAGLDREGEAPSATNYGPELSRDFRGLRLWLPLMLHGAGVFREALAEKLELAQRFYAGLLHISQEVSPLEVLEPQLSVLAFRPARRPGESREVCNTRAAALLVAINAQGSIYLSSTMLPSPDGDLLTLRVAILSHRTHAERIDQGLEHIRRALQGGA